MPPQDPTHNAPTEVNQPITTFTDPVGQEPGDITVGDAEDPKKEGWRSIVSTLLILIAAPLVALVLITFVFQSYEVDGPSMQNTLQDHDRLIVDKIPRTIARLSGHDYIPKRGDIIIFIKKGLPEFGTGEDKQLIKRVVGLPGDRVVVKDSKITIYNKEHPRGFNPDADTRLTASLPGTRKDDIDITIKPGEVFVCGDNRDNSLDSRLFGTVPASDIVGKLSYRIYPIGKAQGF